MFVLNPVTASRYIYNNGNGNPSDWILPDSSTTQTNQKDTIDDKYPIIWPPSFLLNSRNQYILSIRHPISMIPSGFKGIQSLAWTGQTTSHANMHCTSTLYFSRMLYDWLKSNNQNVYIIDADDYYTVATQVQDGKEKDVAIPSPTLEKLCEKVGFDKHSILTKWPKATEEQKAKMPPRANVMLKDLLDSEGIIPKKTRDPKEMKIEDEKEKWTKEFGDEGAALVEDCIRRTMGDYEYLWKRRLVA